MIPLQLSPVDVRVVASASHRFTRAGRRGLSEVQAENVRLLAELKRLREENQDLRDSAAIWIRLYEQQLRRANSHEPAMTAGVNRNR